MEKPFRKYLIVMGAGSGVRMGSALPKQFLDLGGEPVLRRTIRVFLAAVPDIRVITVLPNGSSTGRAAASPTASTARRPWSAAASPASIPSGTPSRKCPPASSWPSTTASAPS